MKKLSVIIVSYNHPELLKDCLDSIIKFNDIGDKLEVIVSDNSPNNDVFDFIIQYYPWVKVIKNKNIGFGAGNNRGVEVSEGEYLLFLNPDTILVESIFEFVLEKFQNKNLALCGVQLINTNGTKQDSFLGIDWIGIFAFLKEKFYNACGRYVDGKMFISGADMFVRKQTFIEAGCFDENIFMYKEEPDLIKRIKLYCQAKETVFYKEKKIIHLDGGTTVHANDIGDRLKATELLNKSEIYYCEKWGLNLKQRIKSRLRVARFKRFVLIVLLKFKNAKTQTNLINFYRKQLQLLKCD